MTSLPIFATICCCSQTNDCKFDLTIDLFDSFMMCFDANYDVHSYKSKSKSIFFHLHREKSMIWQDR